MNILKFNLHNLHNEETYQFAGEVKKLAAEAPLPEVETLEVTYAAFVLLYDRLGAGLEQIRKSEHTAKLHEADRLRDSIYRGLMLHVEACLHSPLPAKAEAARSIMIVVDTYGDFRNRSYVEETATINNFLESLGTRCFEQVKQIGATDWAEALEKANKDFDALMDMRFDEHAGEEQINVRETRRELEAAYEKFAYLVEALAQLYTETQAAIHPFIARLNERIAYYRNLLAQRKGRSEKKAAAAENNSL